MLNNHILNKKHSIYFIGIGGISMSALAKLLITLGFRVGGSDKEENDQVKMLKSLGCAVDFAHKKEYLESYNVVVYNSAIHNDNEQLSYAKANNYLVFSRIEMLNLIMRTFNQSVGVCGCHGKTTTTALISNVLYYSNLDFTAHIGGIDKCLGNMYIRGKDVFVTEVCEYDKNIDKITNDIAIALNIDNDHMDCYKDFDDLSNSFKNYLNRAKIRIINTDDKHLKNFNLNAITIGSNKNCDYSFLACPSNDGFIVFKFYKNNKKLFNLKSNKFLIHDGYNLTATIVLALQFGIKLKHIYCGLKRFCGIARRNEHMGMLTSKRIICDYAHHPSEIESVINNYKIKCENLTVIFQPHTFSRTKILLCDFVSILRNVKNLYIFKTYPARETELDGVSAKTLSDNLDCKNYFEDFNQLIKALNVNCNENETIIVLGAGDLYKMFKEFFKNNGVNKCK